MRLRYSVKAILIEDGRLLCIQKRDDEGLYVLLPGGGQEPGETIHDTLRRECLEEIGAEIEINDLRFVRDYLGQNHEFADHDSDDHQVDLMFDCRLAEGAVVAPGPVPDDGQIDIVWIPLAELDAARIYPRILARLLQDGSTAPVYLGDVN